MPLHKDFLFKTPATSKPETNKPRTATGQSSLTEAQLKQISSISGQAQADAIRALLSGKPEAVKHLTDIAAPALAQIELDLPAEYSLVAKFLNSDAKPSRKQLEVDIASWALQNPAMVR
ncbi:hypothetical protein ACVTMO_14690 [Pseudomonas segetis]